MIIKNTEIEDTFAEAFTMTAARLIVTAANTRWAKVAATTATGYATSVIGCDAEAGIEKEIAPVDSPDGRPGYSLLFFAFSRDALEKALVNRIGQCVLTCPTTACFNGLSIDPTRALRIGGNLRFFGDGWQISKKIEEKRYWRIPVMDGEFVCEDRFGTVKGVAGGNFLILGKSQLATLQAAEKAIEAIQHLTDAITPFPGGLVRSGSKIGSRYKKLRASTNDAYCPTLKGQVKTVLPTNVSCVYEIVIDGTSLLSVEDAMRVGIRAACGTEIVRISAGNYEGKLGAYKIFLRSLF
ncbi:formylmethanofuran--tetrahydromethanopterin N-formyltransferase [Telmatocola sphagniphila]|uniref:Formylmethanofuran--tetrahydromethanopterin formyltransferase n=1 Tax=Telmatocola sphagniphila TaxID=1123043 RepID=A0A8E6B3V7_9BACT|nr:formylmethanofuran--tetrahydromethanopterin N-formyltransferase [Telmatocola sphagniphila]QVL30636.1 formylmethanofuran--tetrahydromethanopterin N-formyltransferase [Telmatocola sphagniphila]